MGHVPQEPQKGHTRKGPVGYGQGRERPDRKVRGRDPQDTLGDVSQGGRSISVTEADALPEESPEDGTPAEGEENEGQESEDDSEVKRGCGKRRGERQPTGSGEG